MCVCVCVRRLPSALPPDLSSPSNVLFVILKSASNGDWFFDVGGLASSTSISSSLSPGVLLRLPGLSHGLTIPTDFRGELGMTLGSAGHRRWGALVQLVTLPFRISLIENGVSGLFGFRGGWIRIEARRRMDWKRSGPQPTDLLWVNEDMIPKLSLGSADEQEDTASQILQLQDWGLSRQRESSQQNQRTRSLKILLSSPKFLRQFPKVLRPKSCTEKVLPRSSTVVDICSRGPRLCKKTLEQPGDRPKYICMQTVNTLRGAKQSFCARPTSTQKRDCQFPTC